jgi:hypothetical protein
MNQEEKARGPSRKRYLILGTILLTALLTLPAFAHPQSLLPTAPLGRDEKNTAKSPLTILNGTILPVRLNSTISSAKDKTGKEITGRIMQDVPLSPGTKIPAGSKVLGQIVEILQAGAGRRARVTLRFDKLMASHQITPITTDLRAIAGFMRVLDAETPPIRAERE